MITLTINEYLNKFNLTIDDVNYFYNHNDEIKVYLNFKHKLLATNLWQWFEDSVEPYYYERKEEVEISKNFIWIINKKDFNDFFVLTNEQFMFFKNDLNKNKYLFLTYNEVLDIKFNEKWNVKDLLEIDYRLLEIFKQMKEHKTNDLNLILNQIKFSLFIDKEYVRVEN